ncbi:MAG: enoyl-CoA hydratase [Mycobacterium sp.]|nr:enoyl-CoA hydratase [Mycobacterium sp.]
MDAEDLVTYEVRDRVALITLNNPDRRNALDDAMAAMLASAVERAQCDEGVHAVVVSGAGKAFCAGADLGVLGAATEEGLRRIYAGFMSVARCPLPTIAAVGGPAVGAGLNLALAADVRIAGPTASFDARFQRLGVHPGGGASWLLQRAIGPPAARAALLFGVAFDAEAAVRAGLALAVADDPVKAACELAAGPAAAPRDVVMATKATMGATASPGSLDSDQHRLALDLELEPQIASMRSPGFRSRLDDARTR